MKKISKKLLALLMVLTLIATFIPTVGINVAAETSSDGKWEYYIEEDDGVDYAVVERYNGNEENVTVPSVLGECLVRGIYEDCFYENSTVITVTLPDSIRYVDDWFITDCSSLTTVNVGKEVEYLTRRMSYDCPRLQNINVVELNPNFASIDGVLMNKSKTEIIYYAEGRAATEYTIPNSVIKIWGDAFSYNKNLKKVNFGKNITTIEDGAFWACENIKVALFDGNPPIEIGRTAFRESGYGDLSTTFHGFKLYYKPANKAAWAGWNSEDWFGYESAEWTVPATAIKATKVVVSVEKGKTAKLAYTVTPRETNDVIKWTSSNSKTVSVDAKGVVKGLKAGKVAITATTTSGKVAKFNVTVIVKLKKLTAKKVTVKVGKSKKIKITKVPKDATSVKFKWSTKNKKIAKVKNGKVTGIKKGSTKITAKSGGKKITIKVTVK